MKGDSVRKLKRIKWVKLFGCGNVSMIILVITFAAVALYFNSSELLKITEHEQRLLEEQKTVSSSSLNLNTTTTSSIDDDSKDASIVQLQLNTRGLLPTKQKKHSISKTKIRISQEQLHQVLDKNDNSTILVDYFANNGYAKAFDTMQYPMGLYDTTTDRTFICYQGPHEDPYIISYHHTTHQWDGPYRIGNSELGHEEGDPVQMHDGRKFAHGEVAIDPTTNRMKKTRKFQADSY
jgi:hypothetical protein